MKILMHGALACGLALTLAACGGSDNDGGNDGRSGAVQNGFGAGFQSAFNAGNSAEDNDPGGIAGAVDTSIAPRNPAAGDLNAISFTTDPVDIP